LAELNAAIADMLADLNERRILRHVGQTRRQLFEAIERPPSASFSSQRCWPEPQAGSALRPLPAEPYVFAEWRVRRAGLDYHVEIERHYYSVPYRFARVEIEARITARTVELFHKGERIAAHMRGSGNGRHTTIADHMPSAHRRFADWTIERIKREAAAIGACTAVFCDTVLAERPHPEQGFRACLGILRLVKGFGRERVEAACSRALDIGARTYGSVRSILDTGLDQTPVSTAAPDQPIHHTNIRGARYYH
jgi:transposase